MTTYETRSHVGADGRLTVNLPPELAGADVRVTVEPIGNGAARLTPEQWRAQIDRMARSMPDFPDVERSDL